MAKKSFLDSIEVPAPCPKDWNEMIGDDKTRLCRHCDKDIYNISAMTRREARKLVAKSAGNICVRMARTPDGKVQTLKRQLHQITRRTPIAAGVLSASLSFATLTYAQGKAVAPPKKETTVEKQSDKTKTQNKDYSKTSQISFTIYDATKAVIPETRIVLTNQKTKEEFVGVTNQDGVARFSLLPPARYKVKTIAVGFRSDERFIEIKKSLQSNIEIELEVGSLGEIVTIEYEFPLFYSIAQEDNENVKQLINSGFKVNTKDSDGKTALHVAVEHENLEMVRFLLARGASVNAKNRSKQTPLLMLEDNLDDEDKTSVEIIRLLISKGADVNAQTDEKETLLMMACDEENSEVVKILLEAGANPNLKDKDGKTAFQKTDSEEMKQILRRYGATQ